MKIRSQLIVTLLLLSVLPMSLLVAFNYSSSSRALRRAVESESSRLADEMELRMAAVDGEIERRVARLGAPLGRLAAAPEAAGSRRRLISEMAAELGEAAPLVDSFEFVPEPATAPAAPAAEAPPIAGPLTAPPPPAPVKVRMNEVLEVVGLDLTDVPSMMTRVEAEIGELPAAIDRELLLDSARSGLEAVSALAQSIRLEIDADDELRERLEEVRSEAERLWQEERAAVAAGWRAREDSMMREVTVPVREDGRRVGSITASVRGDQLLRQVLTATRREQGEIPFAIGADGELFALDRGDQRALEAIPVTATHGDAAAVDEHWVVVVNDDPASGLRFGIARPIRESLDEMRRAALTNFAFGSGLIGLALLGILPLSRRMTRDLAVVTRGAGAIAAGDLSTRVEVSSRNEIGRLAGAFNQMAADLEDNRRQLLDESRRRRDQEVEQRLLRSEFDRKSRELEEARRFQLSLLPRRLPVHPDVEVAVDMRTATEVGGDYYDFHLDDAGGLTVAIGDATGHGARAGTMVTAVKSLFSAYATRVVGGASAGAGGDLGLADFLARAAAAIRRMDLGRMTMALTVARLDGGELRLASAGMPPPLLARAGGGVEEIPLAGMPLGGLQYAYLETAVAMEPGDTLLLMSDGFPELVGGNGEPLGYARAAELFAAAAGAAPREIIDRLRAAVAEWSATDGLSDDVTFVVLRAR